MKNNKKTTVTLLLPILIFALIGPFYLANARRAHQIEVTANLAGGTIVYDTTPIASVPATVSVFVNKAITFTITPNPGYHIDEVNVDDALTYEDVYGVVTYTFTKVKADHTLEVVFKENAEVSGLEGEPTITVLNVAPDLLPGFEYLPSLAGVDGVTPFFEIEVEGSLSGIVTVTLTYDDTGLSEEQENALRLYIGNAVDFNEDGTVNGNDVALIQEAQKSGLYNPIFDLNNDDTVDIDDEKIVKEYANSGIIVNPGHYNGAGEYRVPWIDITVDIDIGANKIWGNTWHLSLFGCR